MKSFLGKTFCAFRLSGGEQCLVVDKKACLALLLSKPNLPITNRNEFISFAVSSNKKTSGVSTDCPVQTLIIMY